MHPQRLADNERELAQWETYTTQHEQAMLELTKCLEAIDRVAKLWDRAEAEERRTMAQKLFDYIVYDMDRQRIVDFRLKPWANRFLVLRAALVVEEASGKKNAPASGRRNMPHTGSVPYPRLVEFSFTIRRVKIGVNIHVERPEKVILREKVVELRNQGMSYPAISRALGISEGTAWNIINKNF